jgi:hypothetical protein
MKIIIYLLIRIDFQEQQNINFKAIINFILLLSKYLNYYLYRKVFFKRK